MAARVDAALRAATEAIPPLYAQVIVRDLRGRHPRLVAYKLREASVWDEEWANYSPAAVRDAMEYYRRFPVIYPALRRHLPRDGRVVEAGPIEKTISSEALSAIFGDRLRVSKVAGRYQLRESKN